VHPLGEVRQPRDQQDGLDQGADESQRPGAAGRDLDDIVGPGAGQPASQGGVAKADRAIGEKQRDEPEQLCGGLGPPLPRVSCPPRYRRRAGS
jgi:hypothetical protein